MKAIVCGATFGEVYMAALRDAGSPFEFAGILARGSARSRECAARYGVPLYIEVTDVPGDVAVACVVVRSGVVGGAGGELTQGLLDRGIHVLQEQPVHPDELADALRAAARNGLQYRVNPFYTHLAPVRGFLAAAQTLWAQRRILFADAACAIQVCHPLLDLLGRALPRLRPWTFGEPGPAGPWPYRTIEGMVAGIPLTLRVQNQLDPADPDNHAHFLLRVTLGTEAGILCLADTHGPVLWTPRIHVDRDSDGAPQAPGTAGTTSLVPAQDAIFERVWPAGVLHALAQFRTAIDAGAAPLLHGRHDLMVAQAWKAATCLLGPPTLIGSQPPRPLPVEILSTAVLAAVSP